MLPFSGHLAGASVSLILALVVRPRRAVAQATDATEATDAMAPATKWPQLIPIGVFPETSTANVAAFGGSAQLTNQPPPVQSSSPVRQGDARPTEVAIDVPPISGFKRPRSDSLNLLADVGSLHAALLPGGSVTAGSSFDALLLGSVHR